MGAAVGALVIVTDLDFLLVFKLLNLIDSFYGGINKWFLASCLVAPFPIIGLANLAAVVSLLAAGAGEEGDVGDTAVGALAVCHGFDEGRSRWRSPNNGEMMRCQLFPQYRMGIKAQL